MGDESGPVRFGEFTLDLANRRLVRAGEAIELGSRYFDALALLVAERGGLVTKDRFMEQVWRGIPVTDEALTQCIRTLRRALEDEASAPRFIATVPKHGYRFLAQVEGEDHAPPITRPQSPAARLAGATTLGALGAGAAGGLIYGVAGTSGGVAGLATVLLLTAALAVLGGAGVGMGMALASLWRGERDWSLVLGGAAGGLVVGTLGSALASHGMEALTGTFPARVTGSYEGLALGAAAAGGLVIALRFQLSRRIAVPLAALLGAGIAGATAMAGGRFYAATLAGLEEQFPASRLDVAGIAALFGEDGFHMFSILGSAMLEGALFAGAIVLFNLSARR